MLGGLFGKKKLSEPVNLGQLKIDFHSHLIPGIDDGVATLDHSIEVLEKFVELGYQRVITTPHVMSDFYKNTREIIQSGLENVREKVESSSLNIQVDAAAEYYLDEHFEALIAKKDLLTFSGNHVLFELSFLMEPRNLAEVIFNIQMAGYQPILAHPERYMYWHDQFEKYEELRDKGVKLQLNMLSLTGHYSPQVRKNAEKMIDAGLVDFAGSDCHRIEHLRILEGHLQLPYFEKLIASAKNSELT